MTFRSRIVLGFLIAALSVHTGKTEETLPELSAIPAGCVPSIAENLQNDLAHVQQEKTDLQADIAANKANCESVEKDSEKYQDCLNDNKRIADKYSKLLEDYKAFNQLVATQCIGKNLIETEEQKVVNSMLARAKKLGWSAKKRDLLRKNLADLGKIEKIPDISQSNQVWNGIYARTPAELESIKADAASGSGPSLVGAGTQTKHNDCAIFTLAAATGKPYGFISGLAVQILKEDRNRSETERLDPEKAIENSGLNGGEMIMVAQSLGRVKVIPISDFAYALSDGKAVMINVIPGNARSEASGHQTVLSKTFQHGGSTWFEMMNSNDAPIQKTYLSQDELNAMLKERGVTYLPQSGSVVKSLK